MNRKKLIPLLLFLLLLLLIICVWCHSSKIVENRATGLAQVTAATLDPIAKKDIDFNFSKDNDNLELRGNFSTQKSVGKLHDALGIKDLNDISKIDENLKENTEVIALTQQLIPLVRDKYTSGHISYLNNKLTIDGVVADEADKTTIDALLSNSTVPSVNNTKVVFVPTDPIKFKIDKENEKLAIHGVFNSQANADKLVASFDGQDITKEITVNSKLIENKDVIDLTTTLISPFNSTYKNGSITYDNELLTVNGTVENANDKNTLDALLKASSVKYENNTKVVATGPTAEELALIAQKEAEAKVAEEKLKQETEAEAKKVAAEKEAEEKAKQEAEAEAKRIAAQKSLAEIQAKIKLVIDSENINFELNKDILTTHSLATIKHIAEILKEHSNINVEIEGHTDSSGNDNYNLNLSQKRVNTVKSKLIEMEIDASRLKATGYGETKPLVSNDTKENRRKNRRVEFKVIGE